MLFCQAEEHYVLPTILLSQGQMIQTHHLTLYPHAKSLQIKYYSWRFFFNLILKYSKSFFIVLFYYSYLHIYFERYKLNNKHILCFNFNVYQMWWTNILCLQTGMLPGPVTKPQKYSTCRKALITYQTRFEASNHPAFWHIEIIF